MSVTVFILVSVSALLHVLWNALVKESQNKLSFAFLTSIVGSLALLPVLGFCWISESGMPRGVVWLWSGLSGLFEALYTICLFLAYRTSDLSVVYPLSRGVAPLMTWMLGSMFLGDSVSLYQGIAVGGIVLGVVGVGASARNPSTRGAGLWGVLLALGTGCAIAGYHVIDRRAMTLSDPPSPLVYLAVMHLFLAFFVTIGAWLFSNRRRNLFSEWMTNRGSVVLVGLLNPLAYILIITALRYGNVTFIAAGRNIGIVFSTLLGVLILKERISVMRFVGALLIGVGVMALVTMTRPQ